MPPKAKDKRSPKRKKGTVSLNQARTKYKADLRGENVGVE
jgi:hypothetical protein